MPWFNISECNYKVWWWVGWAKVQRWSRLKQKNKIEILYMRLPSKPIVELDYWSSSKYCQTASWKSYNQKTSPLPHPSQLPTHSSSSTLPKPEPNKHKHISKQTINLWWLRNISYPSTNKNWHNTRSTVSTNNKNPRIPTTALHTQPNDQCGFSGWLFHWSILCRFKASRRFPSTSNKYSQNNNKRQIKNFNKSTKFCESSINSN